MLEKEDHHQMQYVVPLENIQQHSEVNGAKQRKDINGEKIKLGTSIAKLQKLSLCFPTYKTE